ncbi:MAG: ABC transporter substrate-binding protein, partial [Acidimicrobiales bacterium]
MVVGLSTMAVLVAACGSSSAPTASGSSSTTAAPAGSGSSTTSASSSSSPSSSSSGGAPTGGSYLVGVPVPVTGASAQSGTEIFNAEQLAADDINAAGGVLNHKIVLHKVDAACSAQTSVTAANKLVSLGVKAVVGGYCSGAALPAEPIYQRAGLPDILAAPNSSALTKQGYKDIFLLDPNSAKQSTT